MPSDFNDAILDAVAHRPWPLPAGAWVMSQTWHDLLFAHWPIDPGLLAPRVPAEFTLDLYDGQAWIAVVPFRMSNVGPRGVPSLPWVSAFPELNVRTYVRVGDKPGVYFFSLDAGNVLAVQAARILLRLPYHHAEMALRRGPDGVSYNSRRMGPDPPAELIATYRPEGPVFEARPGSLEYFLTERYCLYARGLGGHPYRLEIHHPPWSLQPAAAEFTRNTMAAASGVALPGAAPLLHFAARQDVVVWPPERLDGA